MAIVLFARANYIIHDKTQHYAIWDKMQTLA